MSTLTSIIHTGLTALQASQSGLKVAAQNVANANTPGYVRTEIHFSPLNQWGTASGVDFGVITRAADRFLAAASFTAEAMRGGADARAELLARAQSSFGDPTQDTSLFASFDKVWDAFVELGVDPSSALRRDGAVSALQSLFTHIGAVSQDVQALISEADERVAAAVVEAQDLIDQIAALNKEIRLTKNAGADASAVENEQSALIDKLSALMDIRVAPVLEGGVHVRTAGGAQLVGEEAAAISYTASGVPFAAHTAISYAVGQGAPSNLEAFLQSGEIKGLIDVRDGELRQLAESLGGLAAELADALNAAHNENVSYPPAGELVGRQTGLLASDALNFSGETIIGVVDSDGVLAQRLTIDLDAGLITAESPAGSFAFSNTIASLTSALDLALGAASTGGDADFTAGRLSLSVGNGGGLVVQQSATDPSARAGRGFAHFFGLNDLAARETPLFFESGGAASDAHGLLAGGEMSFVVTTASGRVAATPTLAIAGALTNPGSSWNNLVAALNDATTGLGQYATFSYDSSVGRIGWTAKPGFELALSGDTTARGATGVSVSSLFGLGPQAGAARAVEIAVDSDIAADPALLAVARPNLSAAIGDVVIEAGDNRGANALAAARDASRQFTASGVMTAQTTSLSVYVSRFAGAVGRLASDAERASAGAAALSLAAADRRAQVEGVSIDDELVRMTTFQNAYAAASRLIQAAAEMYEILVNLGRY